MSNLLGRASIVAAVVTSLVACDPKTMSSFDATGEDIQAFGYTPIRPPNNLPATGSVVLVRSAEPFVLQVVCKADEVIGAAGPSLATSNTVSSQWQRQTGFNGGLDASYLKKLNAKLGGKVLRGVTYSLSDARVSELSDAELSRALSADALTQDCLKAIEARQKNGPATLTMIQSALVADVVYTAQFEAGIDTALQASALGDLAPELNASVADSRNNTLKGEALIWGVRDDSFLLTRLGSGNESGMAATPTGDRSILPFEAAAVLPPN